MAHRLGGLRSQLERAGYFAAAFALACGAGLIVLAGLFALLLYAGLSPGEALLSLNDPTIFTSQLAAAALAGVALGGLRFFQPRSRVVVTSSGVLLGIALGYNLAFAIRSGFAFALVALVIGGSIGAASMWVCLKVVGSQLQVLGLVRRHLRPLLGAIALYAAVVFVYSVTFYLLATNDPGAFSCTTCSAPIPSRSEFIYFSVMTMTALGRDGITPLSGLGRVLTLSEAIIGALIFVAYMGFVLATVSHSPKQDRG